MDQIKIGQFIAERRKAENLTQMQLAQRLGITDRAVSKWECGKALPDASVMLELCDILHISVNDLLKGEKISMENYNQELEETLLEMVEEKVASDKHLLTLEWIIGILSCIVLFTPIIIAAYLISIEEWKRVLICFSGIIPGFIGFLYAVKIEQKAGYYECQKCGHRYIPTYKAVTLAPHLGRTRQMKCPECSQVSWQKKVLRKK